MPRRSVGSETGAGDETPTRPLGTWVAAGLSLAVIGIASLAGVFTIYGVALLAPMVYVLARLSEHAPQARTTSDLVGAVLGERFGVFVGVLQLVAYLLIAVSFARFLATAALAALLDEGVPPSIGWFAVGSVAAVMVAGILVRQLSVRGIAWIAAVLAAVAMLVYFYLAIATIATIYAGTQRQMSVLDAPATHVTYGLDAVLLGVLPLVGFEVATTVNRQARSVGRSTGLAFAVTAGCALTAAAVMSSRLFRTIHEPSWQFATVTTAYLGESAVKWLLIGSIASACAGLLALTFAAFRVAGRTTAQLGFPLPSDGVLAWVVGIIGVLLVVEWLWGGFAATTLDIVGPFVLLAVYVCAAQAAARVPSAGTRIGAEAARLYISVLVAAVVVIPLFVKNNSSELLPRLAIAGLVVVAAAAVAIKTNRLGQH